MPDVQKTPPTSIKVVAILQLIFGGLGLLSSLAGLAFLAAGLQPGGGFGAPQQQANNPAAQMQKEMMEGLEKAQASVPGGKATQYGQMGVDLLLGVMMVLSGIGLLKMQPWGRSLAIAYGVLSLLLKVFAIVWGLVFVIPAMTEFIDAFGAKGPQQATFAMIMRISAYAAVIGPVIVAVYPIIVLYFMLNARTRAAFRGAAGEALPAETPEEDDRWGQG
jgi:hypothetical protein